LLLVRLLAGPQGNVFGVGDDDQTIYGYQGANPEWLIGYQRIFPGAGDHPLTVNYRCPQEIVTAAGSLLRNNAVRVLKTFRPSVEGEQKKDALTIRTCGVDPSATVQETVKIIREEIESGTDPKDIAVLTRVNALLFPIRVLLQQNGVPVQGDLGDHFVNRTVIRSVFAWFHLSRPDIAFERGDLEEALRRPSRWFSPQVTKWIFEQKSISDLERLANRLRDGREATKLRSFCADIRKVQKAIQVKASSWVVVDLILRDVGVSAALETLDLHKHGTNAVAQSDESLVVEQLAALFKDPRSFVSDVTASLQKKDDPSGVHLSTIHRVKGQEWPVIVVHQADNEQFPHKLSEDHEEERRIFHVAITRASRRAVIVSGAEPSQYIDEMKGRQTPRSTPQRVVSKPVTDTTKKTPQRQPVKKDEQDQKLRKKGRLLQASTVWAAPGLELSDAGTWKIEEVHESHVVVSQGQALREIAIGKTVTTVGNRTGRLTIPDPQVRPESIRAFDLLLQIRNQLRGTKPAFIVFHDVTLESIALDLPRSLDQLARVQGIGPNKLELYGDAVLQAIEEAIGPEDPN